MQSAKQTMGVEHVVRDHVGQDIRALRKSRGLRLQEFANQLDRSLGFVSQIERGLSEPTINDLRKIAKIFDVPLSLFFGKVCANEDELGLIVRGNLRRKLGAAEDGLVEELLSPDLGGSFEMVRSEFAPGAGLETPVNRESEEAGYMVTGRLKLEINGKWFDLKAGDSFRFANSSYRWRNEQSEPAIVIWVISPPVY